jgi:hypothetical protein
MKFKRSAALVLLYSVSSCEVERYTACPQQSWQHDKLLQSDIRQQAEPSRAQTRDSHTRASTAAASC